MKHLLGLINCIFLICVILVVPYLRSLVAGLAPRMIEFEPIPPHVRF